MARPSPTMTSRKAVTRAAIPIFTLLFVVPLTPASSAAADVQVFTSGAPSAVQKQLAPAFIKATGHNVLITAETLGEIRKRLSGEIKPDVVVLPRPALLALDKAGELRPGTMINIARVGIGVVVREGASVPDISSVDALRKTLLNAKSIAHPDPKGGGFTGAHIDGMFERLGIAAAVRPKVMLGYAFTGGVANIAKGVAELGLFNISEIVPIKGVRLVGALPAEHQSYIVFAGALHVRSASPEPAAAYLRSLTEPGSQEVWQAGGFELLPGGK